jgi:serralysin
MIVVSGKPLGSQAGFDHTDVVRYTAGGSLDTSFGVGGKLALPGKELEGGLALQSDGKLVLVGRVDTSVAPAVPGTVTEFALMRLNADGSPDAAFGDAGTAHTAIEPGQRDSANAVALQADGRIVVAGSSSNVNRDFAVARYNANGTLDTTFANQGKLTIDFLGFTDIADSVAIQPDGKIVLGGLSRGNVDGYGVARVLP